MNSSTSGKDLPLVVLVGSNYSQHTTPTDFKTPSCASKLALSVHPWVEDDDATIKGMRTKVMNNLKADGITTPDPQGFHLVLTNICPWITQKKWSALSPQEMIALTCSPVGGGSPLFSHIDSLISKFPGPQVLAWIGHTASIRLLVATFLTSRGCAPLFTANNLAVSRLDWKRVP